VLGSFDSQLMRGVLTLALLETLAAAESYGFEIVLRLHAAGLDVSEGSVYPALTRLERAGLLTSRLVASTSGPARKYYALARAGQRARLDGRASWRRVSDALHRLDPDRVDPDRPAADRPGPHATGSPVAHAPTEDAR
jgi:PadR family transcriptional regulator PadR